MQVEKVICGFGDGAQGARARQFNALAPAVEQFRGPYPVHILVDKARRIGARGIETREGGHIGEYQNKTAAIRLEGGRQQSVERHRAAQFVAVDESAYHGRRTRLGALQDGHIGNVRVALFMARDIGNLGQFGGSLFTV